MENRYLIKEYVFELLAFALIAKITTYKVLVKHSLSSRQNTTVVLRAFDLWYIAKVYIYIYNVKVNWTKLISPSDCETNLS